MLYNWFNMEYSHDIITFWFPSDKYQIFWFSSNINPKFNELISDKFKELLDLSEADKIAWNTSSDDKLSQIILYDQLTRHIYTDNKNKNLSRAVAIAHTMVVSKEYLSLPVHKVIFVLMPFRHSDTKENYNKLFNAINEYNSINKPSLNMWNNFIRTSYEKSPLDIIENTQHVDNYEFMKNYVSVLELYDGFNIDSEVNIEINHILKKTISNFFQDICDKPLIVSLSGGVDSMVIIYICKYLALNVQAVHINYKNRSESDLEAEFLTKWCSYMKIPLYTITFKHLKRNGTISRDIYESVTQKIRYRFYQIMNEKIGASGVCFGHHLDDVSENCFTNCLKSRTIFDLGGMMPKGELNNVMIYRPLLNHKKCDIYDFAHKYNIPYFLDTTPDWSNRGTLRRIVKPVIEKHFPGFFDGLIRFSEESALLKEFMNQIVLPSFTTKTVYGKLGIYLNFSEIQMNKIIWKYGMINMFHKYKLPMMSSNNFNMFFDKLTGDFNTIQSITIGKYTCYIWKKQLWLIKTKINFNDWNYTLQYTTLDINMAPYDIITGIIDYTLDNCQLPLNKYKSLKHIDKTYCKLISFPSKLLEMCPFYAGTFNYNNGVITNKIHIRIVI